MYCERERDLTGSLRSSKLCENIKIGYFTTDNGKNLSFVTECLYCDISAARKTTTRYNIWAQFSVNWVTCNVLFFYSLPDSEMLIIKC